jgi:hypothetical protein
MLNVSAYSDMERAIRSKAPPGSIFKVQVDYSVGNVTDRPDGFSVEVIDPKGKLILDADFKNAPPKSTGETK